MSLAALQAWSAICKPGRPRDSSLNLWSKLRRGCQVCAPLLQSRSPPDRARSCRQHLAGSHENRPQGSLHRLSRLCISSRRAMPGTRSIVYSRPPENKTSRDAGSRNEAETILDSEEKDTKRLHRRASRVLRQSHIRSDRGKVGLVWGKSE